MKISIRDRAFGHCLFSSNPMPPVNVAKHMEWDRTAPVTPNTVYTDAEIYWAPSGGIAWLIEPIHAHTDLYEILIHRASDFREIWTHDRKLLELIPNGVFVPFGGCWIAPADRMVWPKTKGVSIIVSNKHGGEGWDMRHAVVAKHRDVVDCYGIEYTPVEFKITGLRDYRFHVVIENVKCDYWFTEKLNDCFATGTIPIYRGCPSIGKFFNTDGIIVVDSMDDIANALTLCTPEFYEAHLDAVRDNFERAKQFYLSEDWLCENRMEEMKKLAV